MQETVEQIILHMRGTWKYRWYALLLACGLIAAGWIVLSQTPIIYTASAKIYVNTSTVLDPLLKGLVIEKDPAAYLGLMTRELVSRPILEQVADKVNLYDSNTTPQEKEHLLLKMERNIDVKGSRANARTTQQDFYIIAYSNRDPKFAKEVVHTLINTFVDKTVAASERDSEAAARFLAQQLKEREEELIAAEVVIAQFKTENINELPQGGVNHFQRLHSAQAAYDEVALKITEAQNQRRELQRQLASTPSVQQALSTDGTPVLSPTAARLEELKAQLDQLLLKYTEKHPDVHATRRSIAELEKQVQHDSTPVAPNPMYQQIQFALGQVESDIAALLVRKAEYLQRVKTLRGQTATLTEIEAKLQRLNENYEQAKQKYDVLATHRGSALMAENVEQAGEDVRFRIIDPPRIIDSEQSLVRKQLIMTSGVLVAGIGGGGVLAFLLSQIWPVIYARRGQEEFYGMPVIGAISQAKNANGKRHVSANIGGFALVCLLILTVHGAVVWQHIGAIRHALQIAGSVE